MAYLLVDGWRFFHPRPGGLCEPLGPADSSTHDFMAAERSLCRPCLREFSPFFVAKKKSTVMAIYQL